MPDEIKSFPSDDTIENLEMGASSDHTYDGRGGKAESGSEHDYLPIPIRFPQATRGQNLNQFYLQNYDNRFKFLYT
jgi:hypothetical protein